MKKGQGYFNKNLVRVFLLNLIIISVMNAPAKSQVYYTLSCPDGTDLCDPFPSSITLEVTPAGASNYAYYAVNNGSFPIWSGPSNTLVIDAPGEYYCVVTDVNGQNYTNNLVMKILHTYHMFLTSSASGNPVCAGSLFSALPDIWNSYQWYRNGVAIPGATSSTYYGTQTGSYNYMAFNSCGSDSSDYGIYIEVDPQLPPSVSLTVSPGVNPCIGQSVILIAPAVAGCYYQWYKQYSDYGYTNFTSGTDLDTLVVGGGMRYSVSLQNACGAKNSSWVQITSSQVINSTFSASGPVQFCPGNSVTLNATQNAGWNYQWKMNGITITGATTNSYTANSSGNYNVAITNSNGCSNSHAWDVSANGPNALTLSTYPFCTNSQEYVYTSAGLGFTYQWYKNNSILPGANNDSLPVDSVSNGSFYVIVNSSCGSSTSAPYQKIFYNPPAAVASTQDPTVLCTGDSVTLTANYHINYGYRWNKNGVYIPGGDYILYEAKSTGSYTATVYSIQGCSATSNAIQVNVNGLPSASITPSGPTTFCSGGSVTLNAPTGTNKTYQWKKGGTDIIGATLSSYAATTGGNYKVTVTNTVTGCSKTTASATVVAVNVLPAATITPQGPTTFCAGGSVLLKGNFGAAFTYQWKKNGNNISGATAKNYTATIAGVYKIKVTNSNGCSKLSAGVTVTVPCREGEILSENSFDVKVFPNPNSGEFTIKFSDKPTSSVQIELTDEIGKVVKRFETNDETVVIKESNLANGIYCLTVRNKDEVVIKKINIVK